MVRALQAHVVEASMNAKKFVWTTAAVVASSYAAYLGMTWLQYGRPKKAGCCGMDELLDMFMPVYDVVDRHHISVDAPADVTLSAAKEMNLESCGLVRGIFKARELILGSEPKAVPPGGIIEQTKSMGWGVLAEVPGHEIVIGAVTKPWDANPVFRAVPASDFAAFGEPGYVKIVWTLRADSKGKDGTVFRTETRAIATDAEARRKFRWYWSFLSPGIIVIRRAMLPLVKAGAERRCQTVAA
jgi:hypothetical protein